MCVCVNTCVLVCRRVTLSVFLLCVYCCDFSVFVCVCICVVALSFVVVVFCTQSISDIVSHIHYFDTVIFLCLW